MSNKHKHNQRPTKRITRGVVLRALRAKLGPHAHVGSKLISKDVLVTHGGHFHPKSGYQRLIGPCYSWQELMDVVNALEG